MYIFVDEAGDLGFQFHKASSTYFTIGCAHFPTTSYKNCVDLVKDTIVQDRGGRGEAPKELKFSRSSKRYRRDFLSQLVGVAGRFAFIYVDKRKIYPHLRESANINYVYNQMVCYLLENVIKSATVDENVRVYMDRRSSNPEIIKDIDRYLPQRLNWRISPYKLKVIFERSHHSRGVQCADLICGSAFKKIERGDDRYYNIIKSNLILEKELFKNQQPI
jgi:hypothetical protein